MAFKVSGNTIIDNSGTLCSYDNSDVCLARGYGLELSNRTPTENSTGTLKISGSAVYNAANNRGQFNCVVTTGSLVTADLLVPIQGASFGYTSGGYPAPPGGKTNIEKYPFASSSNGTSVGDLTDGAYHHSSASSSTHGYRAGGYGPPQFSNDIEKWPFASDTNATDVGTLLTCQVGPSGHSSDTSGYAIAGRGGSPVQARACMSKWPFASDTNASSVGNASDCAYCSSGHSSREHGYRSGAGSVQATPNEFCYLRRFPFASDASESCLGDLSCGPKRAAANSDETKGYTSFSTITTPTGEDALRSFPFSSTVSQTCVASLLCKGYSATGTNSETCGFIAGGYGPTAINAIRSFLFANGTTNSCIGSLSTSRNNAGSEGAQV